MKDHQSGKRVGIWIRVSTEDQARGDSPEHHEKRARCYAESKNWDVIEVYSLEGVSGKSVIEQKETQRMLVDIQRGHITGLIFSKLARLARNTRELLDFAELFEAKGAHLISLQESIDTSTPAGRLFYTMIAAMAQWEREEIAERVAVSIPIRAKLGKPIGGKAPFGYQWKDKKLVPHPEEAAIRKLVYELFLEHRRNKTVARLLNEQGFRTRKGPFTDTSINRMISCPSAKGIWRANYTKSRGPNKRWILKPESEWIHVSIEPIVSIELWEQCNDILNQRKTGKRPAKMAVHLFAGYTHCYCGKKMYVPVNTPKYVCQGRGCRNKIPIVDLESIFYEQLRGFFLSSDQIADYLSTANADIREKEKLLTILEKEEHQVRSDMDHLYQLYMERKISSDGFGSKYLPLEQRLKELGDQIPQFQAEIDFLKVNQLASDQVLADGENLYGRWPNLEHVEKRQIIENITEKVTIGISEVAIDLCYLPSSLDMTKWQHINRGYTIHTR